MNIGSIAGGTNAGWRRVKQAQSADWTCPSCGTDYRKWVVSCPKSDCRHTERPTT